MASFPAHSRRTVEFTPSEFMPRVTVKKAAGQPSGNRRRGGRGGTQASLLRPVASIICLLALCLLPLGGAPIWGKAVVCATIAGVHFLTREHRNPSWPPPSILFLLFGLWSLLQGLPLPEQIVGFLSPKSAEWRLDFPQLSAGSQWIPLSLDGGASRIQGALWISYGLLVRAGAVWASKYGTTPIAVSIWGAASVFAAVSLLHVAVNPGTMLGWVPRRNGIPEWGLAPLLNPNNLACLLTVGASAGVWLAHSPRKTLIPVVLLSGSGLCLMGVMASGSRAGFVSSAVSVAVVFWDRGRRSHWSAWRRRDWSVILGVVVVGALGFFFSPPIVRSRLFSFELHKLQVIVSSIQMLPDFWRAGTGRGAFGSASLSYLTQGANVTAVHVENFPLSWLIEWGVVFGGLGLGFLIWWGVTTYQARPAAVTRWPWVALLGMLLHNLADLGFEVPGLVAVLCLLLGALSKRSVKQVSKGIRARISLAVYFAGPLVVVLAFGLSFSVGVGQEEGRKRAHDVYSSFVIGELNAREAVERLELLMRQQPAESYYPLVRGLLAESTGENSLPWIGASLRRQDTNARAHLAAGAALIRQGRPKQSSLHLRRAMDLDANIVSGASRIAVASSSTLDDLLLSMPNGATGRAFLLDCARVSKELKKDDLYSEILVHGESVFPQVEEFFSMRNRLLLDRIEATTSSCTSSVCENQIEELIKIEKRLREGAARFGSSCEFGRIDARIHAERGDPTKAFSELQTLCPYCRNHEVGCYQDLVIVAGKASSALQDEAEDQFLIAACSRSTLDVCERAYSWLVSRSRQRKRHDRALVLMMKKAAQLHSAEDYYEVARLAFRLNRTAEAEAALRLAFRLTQADSDLLRRIEQSISNGELPRAIIPQPRHPPHIVNSPASP